MQATFIPGKEINSELGIVNAARVSLNKQSSWVSRVGEPITTELTDADTKLIHYLYKHNHWTPFAHARLYFNIHWTKDEALTFYKNANLAGFSWVEFSKNPRFTRDTLKGSLYSWMNNLQYLPTRAAETVGDIIHERYPIVSDLMGIDAPSFGYNSPIHEWLEDYVKLQAQENKELYKVLTATLRVKLPIFVARQIRTSQVGFSYSDLYVENESFVFNEVSRRYVNSDPEFYSIPEWRVREGKNIKQGSTGIAQGRIKDVADHFYKNVHNLAIESYGTLVHSNYQIAPEQARSLLPQSMYTEFYMTGTLHRWAQFLDLRLKSDVQQETQEIAKQIKASLIPIYPDWREVYNLE